MHSWKTSLSNKGELEAETGGFLLQGAHLLLAIFGFVLLRAKGLIPYSVQHG